MNKELSKSPIDVLNESGFPLQIALTEAIRKTKKWRVQLEEHPWRSEDGKFEGFIDIVAEKCENPDHDIEALVIECKRVRKTAWVFYSSSASANRENIRVWGSQFVMPEWKHYNWEDWTSSPGSYQSKYCAIPGQDQGRKNLLERTAGDLVEAVEALAFQEKRIVGNKGKAFSRIYIPVIVTTANLYVSNADPGTISLVDGSFPDNTPKQLVSFVRFRKSLDTFEGNFSAKSIEEASRESERTIFVVNAEQLSDFLLNFELNNI